MPRWSAGERVQCAGKDLRCEVQVNARDISVPEEDRRAELRQAMRLKLPKLNNLPLNLQTYGAKPGVVYVTLENPRRADGARYMTLGYAYKGTAVIGFELAANSPADVARVLGLVDGARALDALEMWTLRLKDFLAVCGERFPAYKEANERAFAASPFAAVNAVREAAQPEPSTVQLVARQRLMDFTTAFDGNLPERRRYFCEGFPQWVARAAETL